MKMKKYVLDEKIRFVSARFGTKGEAITIRLLCKIYRQGYYINRDKDMALLFAKDVGDSSQHFFVNDVVYELLKRGFFNKSIFERFSILTGTRIQRQYFEASKRRKAAMYNPQYLLIDVSEYTNAVAVDVSQRTGSSPLEQDVNISDENVNILSENVNISKENVDILRQSKVKESKVKENKKPFVGTEVPTSASNAEKLKTKKEAETFAPDSVEYKASKFLADKILERDPKNKKAPRTDEGLQKWCVHIDYILRLDKRSEDELRKVLVFATKDPFWSTNILSTAKFREKFDDLFLKLDAKERQDEDNRTNNSTRTRPPTQKNYGDSEPNPYAKYADYV